MDVCGVPTKLKWPNDLIYESSDDPIAWRKVAGMLSEIRVDSSQSRSALVVGLGINVNLSSRQLARIAPNAGSLSEIAGTSVSRVKLLDALLRGVETGYDRLCAGEDPYRAWRDHLAWLGREVEVVRGDVRVRGVAQDVDPAGDLIVRTVRGEAVRFSAGDVSLRPTWNADG
jgi:BirA family biotin operon repressor/biotin-[acetyl-CoA-carboxylase] ligase